MAASPSPAATDPEAPAGECVLLFAFDIGQGIELERAASLLREGTEMRRLKHRHHAPEYFQFRPPPLRAQEELAQVAFEHGTVSAGIELWIYDFGGLSVSYRFPFAGTWEQWIELSCRVSESRQIAADARGRAEALLAAIRGAVEKPQLAEPVEDYAIFRLPAPTGRGDAEALCNRRAVDIARLLRAEQSLLSEQETQDALQSRISFATNDFALIDWNSALLFDDEPDDVIAVLEFANLHLLEMRFLDQQLDRGLDAAYETLVRKEWRGLRLPGVFEPELARVSRMQVDAAILFERVSNALKLLNDQYLARVHRQASQRFRLQEWNTSILRKLDTLESIYQKILDRSEARRMEFLEWIIIVLIALSMLLPFWPGYGGH